MRYLLDTDICIDLIRRRPPKVLTRFTALSRGDVGMSVVTLAELRHGVETLTNAREQAEQAHAIRLDATLVTNNESDFAGFPGLRIENWA